MDLLNQIYPIGSLFFCKTGTGSPASKYGGNWQCLAENVAMPLGTYAPVGVFTNNFISLSNILDGRAISFTEQISSGRQVLLRVNDLKSYAYVDLTKADSKILNLDVWERIP